MSYLPNFVPLDENGDSDGRNRHDLIVDRLVDDLLEDGLDDSCIYFVEKDYWYTSRNVTRDNLHLRGKTRGDLDIAVYDLEKDEVRPIEIKGSKEIPAELEDEERREHYETVDNAHDQLSEFQDAVEAINMAYDIEITVKDPKVKVWADVFENKTFNSSNLPTYSGDHLCNSQAYHKAQESYEFKAFMEGLFDVKSFDG
ncbi:MAG: hypothetical protein ABEJ72_01580, partial [Candidatus Aenigmatarchaeota archaeon]